MAAGSGCRKIEGGGGMLPIVTVVCVIRGYRFRKKDGGQVVLELATDPQVGESRVYPF
jgi:hypothetical protein